MTPRVTEEGLEVDGRELTVRDLDRLTFPATGTTRQDLLAYYDAVAEVLLPHLRERALRLPRYPSGVEGPCWDRACPRVRPDWVPTITVWSAERGRPVEYCMINERAALLWAIGMGSIELCTTLHRRDAPHRPTMLVFELEPGEGTTLLDCCETALTLRELLHEDGLGAVVKTSGGKGLHVAVPLSADDIDYPAARSWARALADRLERRRPGDVVAHPDGLPWRRHKVVADDRLTAPHAFMLAPYSVCPQPRPLVSTPVTWEEVAAALRRGDAEALCFELGEVAARVAARGDLFADVLGDHRPLPTRRA
jgi:bifunctional non-homologous end joining protein LigD